jgi:uncharacterized membrane protein
MLSLIRAHRFRLTLTLAAAGIGVMVYYGTCAEECSYLTGDILGIDLKIVGIAFMAAIAGLAVFAQGGLLRVLLAAAMGVEVFLVRFQFAEDVFCPYCLTYAAILLAAFILHYERPPARPGVLRSLFSLPGEITLPLMQRRLAVPLALFALLGYLFIRLTFTGSALPVYV